ncbi:MAG TPA: hypothetical protein VGM54_15670 [Chthoniobacter sp.]|jgi:hypothetical protein
MITRTFPFARSIALTLTAALAILSAACSITEPPMTATSPFNPRAPEGARLPRQESLQLDSASRKTAALLSAAQKESPSEEADSAASATPSSK